MPAKEEKQLASSLAQRKCLLKVFDALERFIRDYDHDRDSFQLCVRIHSLDKMNETFAECQSVIEKLDAPEALDEHIDERVEFEQRYCKAKGFLLSKRTGDPNQSALNESVHAPQQHQANFHLRLPKIDLPKFNGDFSRWILFRDRFTSMIHVNGDIPTVAKLQYLLQSLEGSAKKPFESVDIAADSYATTWDALLKRYDNRKYLKKQLFKALYEQECATRIHGLVDDYQRHVRALAKLGEPVEYWDLPLIYLLSYKLDHATLRAWEEKTSHKDDVKYDELVDFLYQRVRILNSVGPDSYQSASSKVAGFQQKSFKQKVSVNASASSTPSYSCPLSCSDSHSIRICPVFLGKNVSQRRELASQKRLCWNCLSVGHQSKKCNSKYNCRTCHEKHHSLLHDFTPAKVSATPAMQVSTTEPAVSSKPAVSTVSSVQQPLPSTSRQVSMAVQTACTMTLLETVVLNIVDDHGISHKARALLDSASMSNFISKPLTKNLSSRRSTVGVSVAGIGSSTQKISSAITATIESGDRTISMKLQFLVPKQPSSELPTTPIDISAWKIPSVELADPQFNVPENVDLVIGSETYRELHTGRKISLGEGRKSLVPHLAWLPAFHGSATSPLLTIDWKPLYASSGTWKQFHRLQFHLLFGHFDTSSRRHRVEQRSPTGKSPVLRRHRDNCVTSNEPSSSEEPSSSTHRRKNLRLRHTAGKPSSSASRRKTSSSALCRKALRLRHSPEPVIATKNPAQYKTPSNPNEVV
ncbi:uncharacterized protein LOC134207000 [Armigeres subalbatus]|uniref:uncharacterized protein LOC134207000 n=1 Tax=Armigeres subalbatus TaxID=124917 RepID=UPI002ED2CD71